MSDPWARFTPVAEEADPWAKYKPVDAAPEAPAQKEPEDPGVLASIPRALRRAIPFSDRMVAAGRSVAPEWAGGNDKGYAENLAAEQAADARLVRNHPFLAGTGQAVGGLAIPAGAVGAAGQATSLGTKALAGAGAGAAIGSIYGASDTPDLTNPADTAKHIGMGALAGGAIGGSLPILARGIGAGYNAVADMLTGNAPGISRTARQHLSEAFRADTLPAVQGQVDKLGPDAMLADAGPALLGKSQGASLVSDEGRSILTNALKQRQNGLNARLQSDVESNFGTAEPPRIATGNILAQRSQVDSVNYPKALNGAPPVDITGPLSTVGKLIDANKDTTGGKALTNLKNMLMEEKPFPAFNPDGTPKMVNGVQATEMRPVPKTSAENLHQIKQEIDNVINYDAPGLGVPAGALRNQQGILKLVRGQLNGELEKQVPGYSEANAASSALAKRAEAVETGTKLLDSGKTAMWPEELGAQYSAMEPGERVALAKGLRSEVERTLDTRANDLTAGKNIIKGEGDWNRDRLATVFGPQQADNVINAVGREAKFSDTFNKVVENSQTAQRKAAAGQMKPEPANEIPLVNPNMSVAGLLGTIGKKAANAVYRGVQSDPTASYGEIARILSSQGPERDRYLKLLSDALTAQDRNKAMAEIVGNRGALAAGLLAGGAYRARQ